MIRAPAACADGSFDPDDASHRQSGEFRGVDVRVDSEALPAGDRDQVASVPAKKRPLWERLLIGAAAVLVIGAFANLVGWDIRGWFDDLWDTITGISAGYVVAAVALKTLQTVAAAVAWYAILRVAYPDRVRLLDVIACYAASVALNSILPANLGTLAMLLMFTTIIAGATFAGILGAYAVQKIFWTLVGVFVYLYLFLSVGGSFDIKFAFVHERPWATVTLLAAAAYLVLVLLRRLWPRVVHWWSQAKEGGAILGRPRAYLGWVVAPSLISWLASLGVMAVFLAAYGIPVSFHTLMRIAGGNSIANVTSVTPGGAGVTQAFNVASLNGIASPQDATAYSVAQQLVTTAWNILLGLALVVWAFGWTGGKHLVGDSYVGAKQKAADQKAAHDERKAAKSAARKASSG
jgi:uncharacterized membrane protein YbhN (UPF0104 family)